MIDTPNSVTSCARLDVAAMLNVQAHDPWVRAAQGTLAGRAPSTTTALALDQRAHPLLHLQRAIGNHAVQRVVQSLAADHTVPPGAAVAVLRERQIGAI